MTLDEFLSRFDKVTTSGTDWYMVRCPAHDDRTASLGVCAGDTGLVLHCQSGCDNKDILSTMGLQWSDLFYEPRGKQMSTHAPKTKPKPTTASKPKTKSTHAFKPKTKSAASKGKFVCAYDYTDENGVLKYQSVRYSDPKCFKQRQPDPDNPGEWIWNMEGVERILYRLPELMQAIRQSQMVYLVEGEKDVQSLMDLGFAATCNVGGAGKWLQSYTDVLTQARVVIIPDNDDPGHKHARQVYRALPHATILELPGLPPKGDVSDWLKSGGTADELHELASVALDSPPVLSEQEPTKIPVPYRILGHNANQFFFFPSDSKQIVAYSPSALGQKANLFSLAPINYWESHPEYVGERGVRYPKVTSDLIEQCKNKGVFRPQLRRGRGCWFDDGRIVLHVGKHLVVDGEVVGLADLKTEYIYEQGVHINIPCDNPAPRQRIEAFQTMCEMLPWERPLLARLFMGWVAIAPICGVLRWRPHVWLTGPSQSGKSWIMDHICAEMGNWAIKVQSSTTEAGIRQMLQCDALPVQFDEAEPMEDPRAQANIQRVLELARQASSENGAAIVKGSVAGNPLQFNIRSTFLLASVGVGTHHRADVSRFTILSLRISKDVDRFKQIENIAVRLDKGFYAGLCARSVQQARVIRANAETLAVALARKLGDRRTGDQLGALLAGYDSLLNDSIMSIDDANDYIKELDLDGSLPDTETKDELRLLNYILERRVRGEILNKVSEYTIGELINMVVTGENEWKEAETVLRRFGISARYEEALFISINNSNLGELLKGTKFSLNWAKFLRWIPGVEDKTRQVKMHGANQRCLALPWTVLDPTWNRGGDAPEQEDNDSDLF